MEKQDLSVIAYFLHICDRTINIKVSLDILVEHAEYMQICLVVLFVSV
jgi:hypothetical protein